MDEGHFGRAAESLYITRPALTQQIRKLERQLGFSLLVRDRHPVVPTDSGELLLRDARLVLLAADQFTATTKSLLRQQERRFNLGFVVTPLGRRTAALTDAFTKAAKLVDVDLVELTLDEQTSAVLTGRVDASFAWGPVHEPDLLVEVVLTASRSVMLAETHRLAGRSAVSIAELNEDAIIQLAPDMVGEKWSKWWAVDPRPDGGKVRYGAIARTIAEVLEHVAAGRGVCITADLLEQVHTRSGVAFVPVSNIPPCEIVLCTRLRDESSAVAALRSLAASNHWR